MRIARRFGCLLALFLFAVDSTAQTRVPASTRTFNIVPSSMVEFTVVAAPYSCDIVMERTMKTTEGTTFTSDRTLRHEYRDSQGRIRVELPVFLHDNVQLVTIWDLVTGYEYVLDTPRMVAHRSPLSSSAVKTPREVFDYRKSLPLPKGTVGEDLGPQTIDGIQTEGRRLVSTVPAGAEGNDRPFERTLEIWVAPDMALRLIEKRTTPLLGTQTVRRTNMVRAEQDPALFQVPINFTIVDENQVYKLVFVRPGHN